MKDTEESIRQREIEITGKPPRIQPLKSEEAIELAQEHATKLRRRSNKEASPVSVSDIPEMILSLMCHPDLWDRVSGVSIELLGQGALSPRDRELVVLRVGWLCQAPYEWGEHVKLAKKEGITSEEVESITEGSSADNWSEHERALLKAAEELHAGAMIADPTWEVLEKTLNDKQLFELTVLVGQFTLVAYFQNALRIRLNPDNEGLRAR